MMSQRAEEMNASFPNISKGEKVHLKDINLMNPTEFLDTLVEMEFFQANPDKGDFVNWPIVGELLDPNWFDE